MEPIIKEIHTASMAGNSETVKEKVQAAQARSTTLKVFEPYFQVS